MENKWDFIASQMFSRGKRLHVLQEFLKLSEMKSQKSQDKLIISHQMIWAALHTKFISTYSLHVNFLI